MKLAVWTYEGPPHVGAMRIATAMKGVHFVLHAPQGDTYADLLFTMIERRDRRPPVTYTTFQARDLGGDTAELFKTAVRDAYDRFKPDALLVGASCTAELIQDDPGGLADALDLPIPVVALELPSYQKKENWGAAETFYQIVRALNAPAAAATSGVVRPPREGRRPLCNLLGPTALGFRHRDDITEVRKLLDSIGVDVGVIAPMGASIEDIRRLPDADFNIVLYPEIAAPAADWLKRTFGQPIVSIVPIGVGATRDFIAKVREVAGLAADASVDVPGLRAPWYSRSIDFDLPDRQARFHLRRRDPRRSRPPASRRANSASKSPVSAPTRASTPARFAPPPQPSASKRSSPTTISKSKPASSRCSRSWCSALRWSGTSPSGSASRAP